LTSVDFPTPEELRSVIVRAGSRNARTRSIPSPVRLLTGTVGTPSATASAAASLPGSVQRSSFVRTRTGGEVPLEPPRVEVAVEPGDEEDGVDVRDQHVLLGPEPRRLPRDLRPPREDGLDRRPPAARVADGDPVADRGHAAHELVVAELAPGVGEALVAGAADEVAAPVLGGDARRLEAARGVVGEGRLELVGPAERGQGDLGQDQLLRVRCGAALGVEPRDPADEGGAGRDAHGVTSSARLRQGYARTGGPASGDATVRP
jgi:hypothetical protein